MTVDPNVVSRRVYVRARTSSFNIEYLDNGDCVYDIERKVETAVVVVTIFVTSWTALREKLKGELVWRFIK